MNKCNAPFVFCTRVRALHNCSKNFLSSDCSTWISHLRASESKQIRIHVSERVNHHLPKNRIDERVIT